MTKTMNEQKELPVTICPLSKTKTMNEQMEIRKEMWIMFTILLIVIIVTAFTLYSIIPKTECYEKTRVEHYNISRWGWSEHLPLDANIICDNYAKATKYEYSGYQIIWSTNQYPSACLIEYKEKECVLK